MGTSGSVEFMFERKGEFVFPIGEWDLEELELEVIDGGAEDIDEDDGEVTVTTDINDYGNMQTKLGELNIEPSSVKLERIPTTTKEVDLESAKKILKLIDIIEDDDDVQAVFHNMELTDEIMAQLDE